MVAFSFLPQILGGRGPINVILSFYYCRVNGGDAQTITAVIKKKFFALTGGGDAKTSRSHLLVAFAPTRA